MAELTVKRGGGRSTVPEVALKRATGTLEDGTKRAPDEGNRGKVRQRGMSIRSEGCKGPFQSAESVRQQDSAQSAVVGKPRKEVTFLHWVFLSGCANHRLA